MRTGRKPIHEHAMTRFVKFRVDEKTYVELLALSLLRNMSASEVVRDLIRDSYSEKTGGVNA